MEQLMRLIQQICEAYPDDPSTPSVTVAYIGDRGEYYASVVRYRKAFGGDKQVVCKHAHEELVGAISGLAEIHGGIVAGREIVQQVVPAPLQFCRRHDLAYCEVHRPTAEGYICFGCELADAPAECIGCCICIGLHSEVKR